MLNIEYAKQHLQNFDFNTLFVEELGWENPKERKNTSPLPTKVGTFQRKAVAALSGAMVFEITAEDGKIPDAKTRALISTEIERLHFEHILIFIDKDRSQCIWRWLKKEGKKAIGREHFYSSGQSGDLLISKLSSLFVDISEIENDIKITDVAQKIRAALDIEKVTKKFFKEYQEQFIVFVDLIQGIDNEEHRRWYASVILNRLMFIFFLQKKGFLDGGNTQYLQDKLAFSQQQLGENQFYAIFLHKLFFEGFAKYENQRSPETNALIGEIKYLNGGLFLPHKIEMQYGIKIQIQDAAFENLFQLFSRYSWNLDDTIGGKDNEINPDVLGYIFEKYINQKAFGAYYTRTEITEYLCEQTVYKLILAEINPPEMSKELLQKAGLDKNATKKYDNIADLLLNIDAPTCKKLIYGSNAVLTNLSLLDPACGSGAFLVAAMKTLVNVYAAILGRIDFLNDKHLIDWKQKILQNHPDLQYYIKKQIITHNLYGVDIMEEATEIAKLRLFLTLVASAHSVEQLEPLPNIDFNIMSGNSLIGMMRVDENQFNKIHNLKTPKKNKGKVVKEGNLFSPTTHIQADLFAEEHAKSYQQLINEKEAAIKSYKNAHELGVENLQALRDRIQTMEDEANLVLDDLLLKEFENLKIKYEKITWDAAKKKEGKPEKLPIALEHIQTLEPFHWGYEFSEIFRKKNGFDAIITNPPWDVFQTDEKEFFQKFDKSIKKKSIRIEEWKDHFHTLMLDNALQKKWLDYASSFNHQAEYYKKSEQYKKILTGKLNLYSLFILQSFNLIKEGGYCGIIVPSGIYSDANTAELRKLLYELTEIKEIIGLSNERFIFDGVHHSFKIALCSFLKGGHTKEIKTIFRIDPREAISVSELEFFLGNKNDFMTIPISFVQKQSPELHAIMEVKNEFNFSITNKLLAFPKLEEKIEEAWNLELGSEFNMTSHSYLFQTTEDRNSLPLYEGKMIHQFTNQWQNAKPRYWVNSRNGRNAILGRTKDESQIIDYQIYRIAYRAIARTSDIRTLIATVLPPNVFCGNSLLLSRGIISKSDILIPLAFFNSFALDFYLRQMVSSNINTFYIYQLPVPRLAASSPYYRPIVTRAAKLICTTPEYAELWEEVMQTPFPPAVVCVPTNNGDAPLPVCEDTNGGNGGNVNNDGKGYDRNRLRAELDGIIAHIYGLSEEEFTYILSTFPIVAQAQKDATLAAYRAMQLGEIADVPALPFVRTQTAAGTQTAAEETAVMIAAWVAQIQAGENQQVEFKSTLRVDLKTNAPDKRIEHSAMKTIAAFLNSEGGMLFIGVADNKEILGLDTDFASFSKADKLDEFQKHLDNLLSKLGDSVHHYLKVSFPVLEGKTICVVEVAKATEPFYLKTDKGEQFYIRRLASSVDLSLSETAKYVKEHF